MDAEGQLPELSQASKLWSWVLQGFYYSFVLNPFVLVRHSGMSSNKVKVFFFFYEWEHNGHSVPFLESASLRKGKERQWKRIKQIHKISRRVIKKKIMPSGP